MSLVATGTAIAETEVLAAELQAAIRREAAGYAGKGARWALNKIYKGSKKAMPKYLQALRMQSRLHKAGKKGRRSSSKKHAGENGRRATDKRSVQTYQNNIWTPGTLQSFELGSNIPTGFNEGQRHSDRIWVSGINVRFTAVNKTSVYPTNLRIALVNASSPNLGFGQQLFKDTTGGTANGIDFATAAAANVRDVIITPINKTGYGVLYDRVFPLHAITTVGAGKAYNLWIPIKQYFHYGDQILPNLRLHWWFAAPNAGASGDVDIDLQSHLFYFNKN